MSCIKEVFVDLKKAQAKANAEKLLTGIEMAAYKCPQCYFFHLTTSIGDLRPINKKRFLVNNSRATLSKL